MEEGLSPVCLMPTELGHWNLKYSRDVCICWDAAEVGLPSGERSSGAPYPRAAITEQTWTRVLLQVLNFAQLLSSDLSGYLCLLVDSAVATNTVAED